MIQSGGFLGRILGPLLKTGLHLMEMENIMKIVKFLENSGLL